MKIIEYGMILKVNFTLNHLKIPERNSCSLTQKNKTDTKGKQLPANGKISVFKKIHSEKYKYLFLVFTRKEKNILSVITA